MTITINYFNDKLTEDAYNNYSGELHDYISCKMMPNASIELTHIGSCNEDDAGLGCSFLAIDIKGEDSIFLHSLFLSDILELQEAINELKNSESIGVDLIINACKLIEVNEEEHGPVFFVFSCEDDCGDYVH